jgi:diguanylate cyclase (GGDEF)-like protein
MTERKPPRKPPTIEVPLKGQDQKVRHWWNELPNLAPDDPTETTGTLTLPTRRLSSMPPGPRTHPALVVISGIDVGRTILIQKELIVGRANDCQLVLHDVGLSRHHARFSHQDGEVTCEDLRSKNGTHIRNERVTTRKLVPDDIVRLGPSVTLRFTMVTASNAQLASDMYDSAMRDPLTKAFNRRYFAARLKAELAYASRHNSVISIVAFDVDGFKNLNASAGVAAGDALLKNIVVLLAPSLRIEDVLARTGADEFALLLRGIRLPNAIQCAERSLRVVEQASPARDAHLRTSLSVGVAASDEVPDLSAGQLLGLADRRLFRARDAGGNRVVSEG